MRILESIKILLLSILLATGLLLSGQGVQEKRSFKWDFSISSGLSIPTCNNNLPATFKSSLSNGLVSTFFEIDRMITNHLSVGLTSGASGFNTSSFYSSAEDEKIKIKEISAVILYNFKSILIIGGGPAFFDLGFYPGFNNAGFILKSSFTYPSKSRVYTKLDAQYRHSGIISRIYEMSWHRSQYYDNVKTNHFYIGLGLGLRL